MQIYKKALLFLTLLLALMSCHSKKKSTNSTKSLQNKYATILSVNPDQINNIPLYSFIDEWMNVPYKYAGKDKNGVDCSGFAEVLYLKIYQKQIKAPAWSIYNQCSKITKEELREGDAVFFKIDSDKISHIGIYLTNNFFVHASTSKGVIISSLDENYYKKYFVGSGRIK